MAYFKQFSLKVSRQTQKEVDEMIANSFVLCGKAKNAKRYKSKFIGKDISELNIPQAQLEEIKHKLLKSKRSIFIAECQFMIGLTEEQRQRKQAMIANGNAGVGRKVKDTPNVLKQTNYICKMVGNEMKVIAVA